MDYFVCIICTQNQQSVDLCSTLGSEVAQTKSLERWNCLPRAKSRILEGNSYVFFKMNSIGDPWVL